MGGGGIVKKWGLYLIIQIFKSFHANKLLLIGNTACDNVYSELLYSIFIVVLIFLTGKTEI